MCDSLTENFESSDFEERDFVPFLQNLICSHAGKVPLVIVSSGNKYQSTRRPAGGMMRGHQKRGGSSAEEKKKHEKKWLWTAIHLMLVFAD